MCDNTGLHEQLNPSNVRILLADDHALVRAGFQTLLSGLGFQVVAEASNSEEALRLIQQLKPDVVLMDIAMPGLNGLDATALAIQASPGVRVIILSMHANIEYALHALRAGAMGYLLKNSKTSELRAAIHAVLENEIYLSPTVAKFIAEDYAPRAIPQGGTSQHLTPRQLDILKLIAQGYTRKQIAEKLNISVKTYDTYRAQIMLQLDIHDAAGLVRYAAHRGLLGPDE